MTQKVSCRDGKAAFVAGALPGERIRFRRTRRHRQHDEAELLEVLEPSADRVVPKCAHFGVCGGCALQHLSPEAQLDIKQTELRDNLERVGKVTPREWLPPLRGPVWNYRRRARLGAKFVTKKDRVVVGFRERLAPYVAEIQRCEVLADPVGKLIAPLASMFNELSIRHRIPQIETAVADNVVALVLRVLDPPSADDLDKLRAFAKLHSVRFYLQTGGLDSVTSARKRQAARPCAMACHSSTCNSNSRPRTSCRSTLRSTRPWWDGPWICSVSRRPHRCSISFVVSATSRSPWRAMRAARSVLRVRRDSWSALDTTRI